MNRFPPSLMPVVYKGLWSGRPADASLYAAGSVAFMTDVGNGIAFTPKGAGWGVLNGKAVLDDLYVPVGISPSGTIGTGNSGNITLGTALNKIYSDGIWLYLPAIATTPAITAGLYWMVFSSTTVATIYSNGPGSAAINFSSGLAYTGSTAEITLKSTTVKGNLLGANGKLHCEQQFSYTNSSNTKTLRVRFGGALFTSLTGITTVMYLFMTRIRNLGSPYVQNGNLQGAVTYGNSSAQPMTGSIDTTVDQNLTVTGQLASATDYLILTNFIAELLT